MDRGSPVTPDEPLARRRTIPIRVLLSCCVALGLGSLNTMASLSAATTANPGPMTAAQLDVVANGQLANVANIDSTHVEVTWRAVDLLPGEYPAVTLTATNGGSSSMPLDVLLDGYATGPLGPYLDVQLWSTGTPTVPLPQDVVNPSSWRQSGCTGATRITGWRRLGTAATPTSIVSAKVRLNVGQSVSYCIIIAMSGAPATYEDTSLLNQTGGIVFEFKGTQVGAP